MIYLGIDVGQKGGVSFVGNEGQYFSLVMPDVHELHHLLDSWKADFGIKHCFLEHAQAMPKQGVSSMFTYGTGFGMLQGLLVAHEIPYTLIKPQEWQREMFKGTADKKAGVKVNPKKRALEIVKRLFPKETFFPSIRSRIPHDGMIDSVLLAELCRRKIL